MAQSRAAAANAAKEVVSETMLVKQYRIVTDGILAAGPSSPESPGVLTGIVTKADLEAANVDFEWLLKTNQIEDAGYAPVS